MYGSIPKQYCIGSTTSKSLYSYDNWGGSDNKYHRTNIQASEIIFHFPVESRRTLLFSQYFGLSSYEAWRLMWWYRSYKIQTSLYIYRVWILVASEHQLVTLRTSYKTSQIKWSRILMSRIEPITRLKFLRQKPTIR